MTIQWVKGGTALQWPSSVESNSVLFGQTAAKFWLGGSRLRACDEFTKPLTQARQRRLFEN
jgi:hypothetical protein